jgi:hypothetical protein
MALIVTRAGEAPQTMSDEDYVRTCIVLANCRDDDPDAQEICVNAYHSIRANQITMMIKVRPDALAKARQFRTRLIDELGEARKGAPMSPAKRAALDTQLEGVEVITDLGLTEGGTIVHSFRYVPHDDDAAVALFRAFIYRLQGRLLTCPLIGCNRFFLHDSTHRKYCSPEHTREADSRMNAAKRQQRFRDRQKAKVAGRKRK